jgi:hypothetical protein
MAAIKTIILNDGGVDKTFEIRKFTGWSQFIYTNKLISMIAETDMINSKIIIEIINRMMRTGVSNPDVSNNDIQNLLSTGGIHLSIDIVINLLANLTEYKQIEIMTPLINCVQALNPQHIQLDLIEGSDKNVNLFISDFINLYKLAYAVLEFNYGHFFTVANNQNLL